MQFKVGDHAEMLEGEVLHTTDNNSVLVKIGGKQHILRLLKSGTNEFEFLLDNSFHYAKILQLGTAEVKIIIDGQPLVVKKHSNITATPGTEVKKGDVIVVLESMKMQVAVKAHKDGNLKEIKVKQGTSVARNEILAVIE
jgi:biotin carboxyl carrier protein